MIISVDPNALTKRTVFRREPEAVENLAPLAQHQACQVDEFIRQASATLSFSKFQNTDSLLLSGVCDQALACRRCRPLVSRKNAESSVEEAKASVQVGCPPCPAWARLSREAIPTCSRASCDGSCCGQGPLVPPQRRRSRLPAKCGAGSSSRSSVTVFFESQAVQPSP